MATATSAPSGLAIARDGNKYSFSWKIPSCKFEAGQQCQYRLKTSDGWGKWQSISVSATATKKTVTVSANSYYPNTKKKLSIISFRVRGQRKGDQYTWSAWKSKSFDVKVPSAPTLSASLSSSLSNVTTFTWKATDSDSSVRLFDDVLWESILIKDCTETDGSKLKWKSSVTGWMTGTGTASGSRAVTEDTATLANASYTRWFRVCSRGAQGASGWKYTKHVYATPYQVTVNKVSAKNDTSGGMEASITWTAQTDAAHPIDSTIAQYSIATPAAGLTCPSGASWQNVDTTRDTTGKDAARFTIDDQLDDNQCLWLRVNTTHDKNTNYGVATLAMVGNLSDPENVSVSTNSDTHRATITATNSSSVTDSFLAVIFRRSLAPNDDLIVGIIPHGSTSVTVQCPDWGDDPAVAFGVYAVVGSYTAKTRSDGADSYSVTAQMQSANIVWQGGAVPVAPDEVTASKTNITGTIRVTWNWTWTAADAAELSWADHEDAWESTAEPDTYQVSNLFASAWNISGLDEGKIWYVRVRLLSGETFGPYSDIITVDLSSAPFKPVLTLSSPTTLIGNLFTAYWSYISADTTAQAYAEVCTAEISSGTVTYGDVIARVETAQHVDITCPEDWTEGDTYLLCLRVTSASGNKSEWSDPVAITVAEPLTATITNTSLVDVAVPEDSDDPTETRTVLSLTVMPLTVTVTGAGTGGVTTVVIERAADYHIERPDETERNGFEGETIIVYSQLGEDQITIDAGELIGTLDDGGSYRLIATVQDGIGQHDSAELEFEVHWAHQANEPSATVCTDGTAVRITPEAPANGRSTDVCDIYRLSADRPVLIVEGGTFGTTYVDPYPAIGGSHRIVTRTADGDYTTADGSFAWVDVPDGFELDHNLIDFDGQQIALRYDLSLSNTWKKTFTETKYLGGSVTGDWSPAVDRSLSMAAASITTFDADTINYLRKLAVYPGICHVRTMDGSSFDADIQVSEARGYTGSRKVKFDLAITRVDPEGLAGLPLSVWEED